MPNIEQKTNCCDGIAECLNTDLFKALSDPSRVSILIRLAEVGIPQTVTEVSSCCPQNMSVVSRHLKILREAGILSWEKQGKEVYYTVRTDDLVNALRDLANAIETCCPEGTCQISGDIKDGNKR